MESKQATTARLLAYAVESRLPDIQFGLLARSLPPFDPNVFLDATQQSRHRMQLALIGFSEIVDLAHNHITTDVEHAILWRNDPRVTLPLVVILNPAAQVDKIHSLEMLQPLTDEDFWKVICKRGVQTSKDQVEQKLWNELSLKKNKKKLGLVAEQVANLYHGLKVKGSDVATALLTINLLPDPLLPKTEIDGSFRERLLLNRDVVTWLLSLDARDYRSLARALPDQVANQHSQTYRQIKQFAQKPSIETLAPLTLERVLRLKHSKKAPETPTTDTKFDTNKTSHRSATTLPDRFLVDQLLQDLPEEQLTQLNKELTSQAERIAELFLDEAITEDSDTVLRETATSEDDPGHEVLIDFRTGEEVGQVRRPDDPREMHPLNAYMDHWVRPDTWGGEVTVNLPEPDNGPIELEDIFRDDFAHTLSFKPFSPLSNENGVSLFGLLHAFDEQVVVPGTTLVNLMKKFDEARRELTKHTRLFLYYPKWGLQAESIKARIEEYLESYEDLGRQLQTVSRQAQSRFPDAVQRAVSLFLMLDTILIGLPHPEEGIVDKVLLTPLHPLHLWKWHRLIQLLHRSQGRLTERERLKVHQVTEELPTLLNTFLLPQQLSSNASSSTGTQLAFAGEISNPSSETTVGVPYFQSSVPNTATKDGLREFSSLLPRFLALYPPARLGLTIVIVDPPELDWILQHLVQLHDDGQLDGVRLYVYYTTSNFNLPYNETPLLFRENLRWNLVIKPDSRDIRQIKTDLDSNNIYPHLFLLCDPSQTVVQSTFRVVQESASPFGVPVQLTYDSISDTVKLTPTPTGHIFDVFSNLRNILSGDLQRSVMGVGKRTTPLGDLKPLIDGDDGANWLIIIDWPHGSLELSSNLGKRLALLPANSRVASVHTNEFDWEQYWQQKLQHKLATMALPPGIDPNYLLDRLLELFPILPEGLIELVTDKLHADSHDTFKDEVLIQLLALISVLAWYRRTKPGVLLFPIPGKTPADEFFDWYGDASVKHNNYYLALWLDGQALRADVLAIQPFLTDFSTLPPLPNAAATFTTSVAFAYTLDKLFQPESDNHILAPIRRALLRERITTAVFSTSSSSEADLLSQNRTTKAEWAKTINELFHPEQELTIRLLAVRVALHEQHLSEQVEEYIEQIDNFKRRIVNLSSLFLRAPNSESEIPSTSHLEELVEHTVDNDDEVKEPVSELESASTDSAASSTSLTEDLIRQGEQLRRVLVAYGIAIASVDIEKSQVGPRFIRYWVKLQPPAGRLSEVQKYAEDIARELGSQTVPFIDNIPGEQYVGIDLAREHAEVIPLGPALEKLPIKQPYQLFIAAGQNPAGNDVQIDLAKLPHMLVAGQTGSGKTVFLDSLITSLIWRHNPESLKLLLVDPKRMDFGIFNDLPHLYKGTVVFEPEEAIHLLRELLLNERETRTNIIQQSRCPNIIEYNRRNPEHPLPSIVVVIDEFADIILTLDKRERNSFERQINRLAATGRAVGIHLVLATQRPTTDVITGTIKANIPARVSFRLPSLVDSRTILDRPGAENLLGNGDMLLSINNQIQRLQSYYASYEELQQFVNKWTEE